MSHKIFYDQIGARIQGLRQYYNISLEALAQWMNVTPCYLNMLEHGHECPLVNRYAVISKAFDIPLDYMFTGKLVKLVNYQSLAATVSCTADTADTADISSISSISNTSSPASNPAITRFSDAPPVLRCNDKARYTLECYNNFTVGNRIHKLRLHNGFSLEELANQLEIIPLHLYIIEYGKMIGADPKVILMLSRIFNVSTDYLVFGEDDVRINRLVLEA